MSTKRAYTFEELQGMVGKELFRVVSPPVALSDIRKHAIAVYWPEKPPPLFWNEEYARTTPYGGIVAPEDFNPFAWPIEGPGRFPYGVRFPDTARNFNAASDAQYFAPIRAGDVITTTEKLVEVYQRTGRQGRLLFMVTEARWTNQRGELVKTHRGTQVIVMEG